MKTIKNNKHKIIGLEIGGRKYLLNNKVCLALELEEKRTINQLSKINEELKNDKQIATYTTESKLLKTDISISNQTNDITLKSAELLNVLKTIKPGDKKVIFEILEEFIQHTNKALTSKEKSLKNKLQQITKKAA